MTSPPRRCEGRKPRSNLGGVGENGDWHGPACQALASRSLAMTPTVWVGTSPGPTIVGKCSGGAHLRLALKVFGFGNWNLFVIWILEFEFLGGGDEVAWHYYLPITNG